MNLLNCDIDCSKRSRIGTDGDTSRLLGEPFRILLRMRICERDVDTAFGKALCNGLDLLGITFFPYKVKKKIENIAFFTDMCYNIFVFFVERMFECF